MPPKQPTSSRKFPVSRIISLATLALAISALVLALRQPKPVAPIQGKTSLAANAQSFQAKVDLLAQTQAQGQSGAAVHLTGDEIRAALAQASQAGSGQAGVQPASPQVSATLDSGSLDQIAIGEPLVSFEGDQVQGQFASEIAGKRVYVTVSGRLGAKDGYATFEPTSFKVGDLTVPVSLVNDALQKRLLEQRDRLKLPDYVSDVRIENGELVIIQK